MNPEIHLDVGARALDALSPSEAAAFDEHLAHCDSCTVEYGEFLATTAMLAAVVAERAPAGLRDKVMRAAALTPQLPPSNDQNDNAFAATPKPPEPEPTALLPRRRFGRPAMLIAAAASALIVAGGVILGLWLTSGPSPGATAAQCVAAASDAHVEQPSVGTGGSVVYSQTCDAAIVQLATMPTPPPGRAYQLWVMAGSNARSVGMVATLTSPTGQIVVTGLHQSDTDIGISIEPTGGSKAPTTTPVWVTPLTS